MSDVVHLRAAGCSVVLDLSDGRLPRIVHWGADLGSAPSASDVVSVVREPWVGDSAVTYPQPVPILGQLSEGWLEEPGLMGFRLGNETGAGWAPKFVVTGTETHSDATGGGRLQVLAVDKAAALSLEVVVALDRFGVLTAWARLQNDGDDPYAVLALTLRLPVPDAAEELLDFAGRWSAERAPQRRPFTVGVHRREARGGKPGLEGVGLVVAGEPGFGFRAGRVWAVHLGWGGSQSISATRTPYDSRFLGGAELLQPGELILQPGESYRTPDLLGSFGEGLDDAAARFHALLRDVHRGTTRHPRPVTWNSWESSYFDQQPDSLLHAASLAAELGIERFVLDDGWFRGRRDDHHGLGDWVVDSERWPDGLEPLARQVHGLRMQFGLWVEPEMVSPDSELARRHPEWLFDAGHGPGLESRHQWALDLGHDAAYAHVRALLCDVVERCGVDFLKWDHNRYLLDAGHQPSGRAGLHAQALAVMRLMRELVERFPGLEIESCASGGGRLDLGTLQVASRVWPSDCNDPHERRAVVRWTGLLVPQEMLGTHVGASPDHITGRTHNLAVRAMHALWGNLGIELDLNSLPESDLSELAGWISLHKELRSLLHSGVAVHADTPGWQVDGVVSPTRSRAVYLLSLGDRPVTWPPPRIRLPGLDADAIHSVRILRTTHPGIALPPWAAEPLEAPGAVLEHVGLEAPGGPPDSVILLEVTRASQD